MKGKSVTTDETDWRSDPDVTLMERVRDGDRDAFNDLFAKYSGALVNFAYRFVGRRDRAEELVQEAFLQIFRARGRYQAKARFTTYLYRVMTNLCLNELRRFDYQGKMESTDRRGSRDDEAGRGRELPDERIAPAEELVAGLEAGSRIQMVLDKLPANQKLALLLSRVEGLAYLEVAECLQTTESAVKSLIFRATRTLREELGDLLE